MTTENKKVRSGNRIDVLLDGKRVGLIQSVDCDDDFAPEPASGIGDGHVSEYVPTLFRHSVRISQMTLFQGTLRDQGIALENGDDALQGLVFDIELFDKDSGQLLRKYTECSYASGSISVGKHRIVMANAVFNALDVTGTAI